jgi:hypothetical protein
MDNTIIQIDLDIIKYLNDKTCDEIIKLLTSKNLLGKGFWGSVYKFEIKNHKVSIKIQPLENDKMYDPSVEDKRNIELEINLLKQISQYKIKNSFGHFPYFYFSRTCSDQSLMFYEYYSYNLKEFFYKEYNLNDFKNIVSQILISIYFFQQVTGYYHNDIHVENFLVNKLNQPLEQTYTFETINLIKTFIFNKYLISIWDFANAVKINSSDLSSTNSDLEQFKVMFHNFSKKIIELQLDYIRLYDFGMKIDKDKFNKYYLSELQKNKIKWNKVSNIDIRSNKIEKSVKKSIIYWIIENNYLDELIKFYELNKRKPQIYLPTNEMLKWINNLPNNFNDIFSNY